MTVANRWRRCSESLLGIRAGLNFTSPACPHPSRGPGRGLPQGKMAGILQATGSPESRCECRALAGGRGPGPTRRHQGWSQNSQWPVPPSSVWELMCHRSFTPLGLISSQIQRFIYRTLQFVHGHLHQRFHLIPRPLQGGPCTTHSTAEGTDRERGGYSPPLEGGRRRASARAQAPPGPPASSLSSRWTPPPPRSSRPYRHKPTKPTASHGGRSRKPGTSPSHRGPREAERLAEGHPASGSQSQGGQAPPGRAELATCSTHSSVPRAQEGARLGAPQLSRGQPGHTPTALLLPGPSGEPHRDASGTRHEGPEKTGHNLAWGGGHSRECVLR